MRSRFRLAWALSIAALQACGSGEPGGRVLRADSAGITVVTYPGEDLALPWRFEKILDLGGAGEGPEAFHRVESAMIATDTAGRLYVLDAGNFAVNVFDRDGRHLRSFGRKGAGPGELRFPSDLGVADDGTIAVYDFARQGVLRFAPDGSPLDAIALPGALQRKLSIVDATTVIGAFNVQRATPDAPLGTRLMRIGRDSITLAAIESPAPKLANFACMAIAFPPLLSPTIAWSARGDRVLVSRTPRYDIEITDAGQLLERWRRSVAPIPSTRDLAAAELGTDSLRMLGGAGGCAVSAAEAADNIGWADQAQAVKDIAIGRDGFVWVRRRTATPERYLIDVWSPDGEYKGTLPADAPFPAAFRGPDEIATVETDELDLPHVVVWRILRG